MALLIGSLVAGVAFTGASYAGKYLEKALGGGRSDAEILAERHRHNLATERFQRDMAAWQKRKQQYQSWLQNNYADKLQADKNFESTDMAFKLYGATHRLVGRKPQFNNYYKPSKKAANGEYAAAGLIGIAGGAAIAYML